MSILIESMKAVDTKQALAQKVLKEESLQIFQSIKQDILLSAVTILTINPAFSYELTINEVFKAKDIALKTKLLE